MHNVRLVSFRSLNEEYVLTVLPNRRRASENKDRLSLVQMGTPLVPGSNQLLCSTALVDTIAVQANYRGPCPDCNRRRFISSDIGRNLERSPISRNGIETRKVWHSDLSSDFGGY